MTAQHLFTVLFNAGIAISIGATVAALGMSFTVRQLIAPLRRVVLVVAMIVLNAETRRTLRPEWMKRKREG